MSKKEAIDGKIEVTSQQLLHELSEIKDRVGALENVAGIANQDVLVKYFSEVLINDHRRKIMSACREPQTKNQLKTKLAFNSSQALDHHLKPLREGLLHESFSEDSAVFEWSLLFKRMPEKKRKALLHETEKKGNQQK